MRTRLCFVIGLALILVSVPIAARNELAFDSVKELSEHSFWIDSLACRAFSQECHEGDILEGEFKLIQDGGLFIGDQTKYDNWLHRGIDFFICSESAYGSWQGNEPVNAILSEVNVHRLEWRVNIPYSGKWFIVYYNPSIYMKQIESSFVNASAQSLTHLGTFLLAILGFILGGLAIRYSWKRRTM